jgi:hypothetical protein
MFSDPCHVPPDLYDFVLFVVAELSLRTYSSISSFFLEWLIGEVGASCDTTCDDFGECDAAGTAAVTTDDQLATILGALNPPLECDGFLTVTSSWDNTDALPALTLYNNTHNCMVGGSLSATCEAIHSNWRRICKCIAGSCRGG